MLGNWKGIDSFHSLEMFGLWKRTLKSACGSLPWKWLFVICRLCCLVFHLNLISQLLMFLSLHPLSDNPLCCFYCCWECRAIGPYDLLNSEFPRHSSCLAVSHSIPFQSNPVSVYIFPLIPLQWKGLERYSSYKMKSGKLDKLVNCDNRSL